MPRLRSQAENSLASVCWKSDQRNCISIHDRVFCWCCPTMKKRRHSPSASFQAGTKCEVPPFLEATVVCSRFLPLFPQPYPLLSISMRIPSKRHSLDGNLSWGFPQRISFPLCKSELMWLWCAATQARCPALSGQGISREGEARQHPDSTSIPW